MNAETVVGLRHLKQLQSPEQKKTYYEIIGAFRIGILVH